MGVPVVVEKVGRNVGFIDLADGLKLGAILGSAVEIGNLVGNLVVFLEKVDGEPESDELDSSDGAVEGNAFFVIADG